MKPALPQKFLTLIRSVIMSYTEINHVLLKELVTDQLVLWPSVSLY